MSFWPKRKATVVEPFKATLADHAEKRRAWREEWDAARDAAVAAVAKPAAEYQIWQEPMKGWWRVGRWSVRTIPAFFGLLDHYSLFSEPQKPSMDVSAYGWHEPFEPKFKTEREARKWLKEYVSPPPRKCYEFDAAGTELEKS